MSSQHAEDSRLRLSAALGVTLVFFFIELIAGFWTGSLTLLADAGHMLTDAGALLFSLFALWIKTRPPTPRKTFGYHRTEVIVALVNGLALWAVVGVIAGEAWQRWRSPQPVDVAPMLAVAVLGLAANAVSVWILRPSTSKSIGLRSAYLHVLSDSLGSVGAIISGLIIWKTGWLRADPLVSLFICALILRSTWSLLRDSFQVLMEGVPAHLDTTNIEAALRRVPGVVDVHDLHVWSIATGFEALSGHLKIENVKNSGTVLAAAQKTLRDNFNIEHATIQIEEACDAIHVH